MTTTTELTYATAPNKVIQAANGIAYAYREVGTGAVPLVLCNTSGGTWRTGIPLSSTHSPHSVGSWLSTTSE